MRVRQRAPRVACLTYAYVGRQTQCPWSAPCAPYRWLCGYRTHARTHTHASCAGTDYAVRVRDASDSLSGTRKRRVPTTLRTRTCMLRARVRAAGTLSYGGIVCHCTHVLCDDLVDMASHKRPRCMSCSSTVFVGQPAQKERFVFAGPAFTRIGVLDGPEGAHKDAQEYNQGQQRPNPKGARHVQACDMRQHRCMKEGHASKRTRLLARGVSGDRCPRALAGVVAPGR